MNTVFLKILNMSIVTAWLVLAVVLLRPLLKKAPRWIQFVLWGIVALRLMIPFAVESSFSLVPSPEVFPQDILTSQAPAIHSGISAVNGAVNPVLTEQAIQGTVNISEILSVAAIVWVVGMAVMLLYAVFSYVILRLRVRISIPYRDNVYICDQVDSPFILNIISPRIYIPSGLEQTHLQHVLAHEYAHIKRMDPLWKPLGFLLLTVHWFNPLLWVAYVLLCRDIELACDEKVISKLDAAGKKGYSQALVACSVHRRTIMACPVAFGELSVKERIKNVLSYKKPAFWIIAVALAICLAVAMCFLTNPVACAHSYQTDTVTAPSCTHQGVQAHTCQLCAHSYHAPVEPIAHSYGQPVVLENATCIATGLQKRTCSCGDTITEPIPLSPHTDGQIILTKAPNCTQCGEESTRCTYCQAEYVVNILPPNQEHALVETVLQAATCTAAGEGVFTCTRCGYEESCVYEPLDHNYKLTVYPASSCLKGNEYQRRCIDCGFTLVSYDDQVGNHCWVTLMYTKQCADCHKSVQIEDPPSYSLLDDTIGNKPSYSTDPFPVIKWDLGAP